MADVIYLDHAAATPLDTHALHQMQPFLTTQFYNPSATYLAAKEVRRAVDEARERTAKALGVRPAEVIFTAGATEANNLAIHGVMARYPDKKVLVSAAEHASVLSVARQFNHQVLSVTKNGIVDSKVLEASIDDDVVLVSVLLVNNEVGAISDLNAISSAAHKVREQRAERGIATPLYVHTDAAQAPNIVSIQPKKLGVDLLSLNGSKIYGPKQTGALYVAAGLQLEPLMYGGGQEFGLRSGTENVAGIVGFSYALEKAVSRRQAEEKRFKSLHDLFVTELEKYVPNIEITLPRSASQAHNFMHILVPGADNERLMMELDEVGIQCAVGSACSASDDEPSHVLKAMGLSDKQAQTSLRFTMGRATTEADIRRVVATLAKLV